MNSHRIKGCLLDTHALLWMVYGDDRLSAKAAKAIDGDLPLYYSIVSLWEIGIKLSGRGFDFEIHSAWDSVLPEVLESGGISLLVPQAPDCRMIQDLPLHHRDPFDRMLVCQASRGKLGIISADEALDAYAVHRIW